MNPYPYLPASFCSELPSESEKQIKRFQPVIFSPEYHRELMIEKIEGDRE